MQPSLIVLLVLFIGLAAMSYYLGFVTKERLIFRRYAQTGFFMFVLLSAFVLFALLRQGKDVSRLEDLGIAAHESIEHSIGMPAGPGIDPTWVFASSESRETVMEFYREEESRPGWELVSDGFPVMLVLEKEGRRLTIGATESPGGCTVSFLLSP